MERYRPFHKKLADTKVIRVKQPRAALQQKLPRPSWVREVSPRVASTVDTAGR